MKNMMILVLAIALFSCKKDEETTPVLSSEKYISAFSISSLTPTVEATVDQASKKITALVPVGTDLTNLTPTITVSEKASVSPASGTPQNFSKPVQYTVTAEDGTTGIYTVSVQSVPLVLLYNSASGDATVMDAEKLEVAAMASVGTGWSSVLNMGGYQMLFYNKVSGDYEVVQLPSMNVLKAGNMEHNLDGGMQLGRDTMLFFNPNHVLVYLDGQTMERVTTFPNINNSNLDKHVLAGKAHVLYGSSSGDIIGVENKTLNGAFVTNIAAGFTQVINLYDGTLMFYNATTGSALKTSDINPYPSQGQLSLGSDWTIIVNMGLNKIIFYNGQTGTGKVTNNNDFSNIPATIPAPASGGSWTHMASSAYR